MVFPVVTDVVSTELVPIELNWIPFGLLLDGKSSMILAVTPGMNLIPSQGEGTKVVSMPVTTSKNYAASSLLDLSSSENLGVS